MFSGLLGCGTDSIPGCTDVLHRKVIIYPTILQTSTAAIAERRRFRNGVLNK